jgi:integrase-like protein
LVSGSRGRASLIGGWFLSQGRDDPALYGAEQDPAIVVRVEPVAEPTAVAQVQYLRLVAVGLIVDLVQGDALYFHCLRHHLASLLIHSGCDVKTVQARMRHSSAKTTLDVYGHMWPERDETTRTAIGGVIAARLASSSGDSAGAVRAKRP